MRILPCLLLSMALAACGSQHDLNVSSVSAAPASGPSGQVAPTAVESGALQSDDSMTADDIGATVLGDTITVPAFQELQLAAVVSRKGVFSPLDSFVSCLVSNAEQVQRCRLIAFIPDGPLRSGTTDTLIMILGKRERFSEPALPMYGNNSPAALRSGEPYVELFDLIYGDAGVGHSYSNDIHHPENTLFTVHVYGRLVALSADDPRQQELHAAGHPSSISSERSIASIDEIVGPARTTVPSASATF